VVGWHEVKGVDEVAIEGAVLYVLKRVDARLEERTLGAIIGLSDSKEEPIVLLFLERIIPSKRYVSVLFSTFEARYKMAVVLRPMVVLMVDTWMEGVG